MNAIPVHIYCTECPAKVLLPYTDEARNNVSIAAAKGWLFSTGRWFCPSCSAVKPERDKGESEDE